MSNTINRSSDYRDTRRNSFGFHFPNHTAILGTKSDVHTFFWILHDLISDGIIEDNFKTITHDLYRTLVNHQNFEAFKDELPDLKVALSTIVSKHVNWERYPFNRENGQYDYQQCRIDPTRKTLAEVFRSFFKTLERAPHWIQRYLDRGEINSNRLYVGPTEIVTGMKFKKYSDQEFMDAVNDPYWLREPGDRAYKYPFTPIISRP